jgi:hypothetical protein
MASDDDDKRGNSELVLLMQEGIVRKERMGEGKLEYA